MGSVRPNSCTARSLAVASLAFLCLFAGTAKAQQRGGALVGKSAPEFHVPGIFGETYSLEKFKGHILVMQFGASW